MIQKREKRTKIPRGHRPKELHERVVHPKRKDNKRKEPIDLSECYEYCEHCGSFWEDPELEYCTNCGWKNV